MAPRYDVGFSAYIADGIGLDQAADLCAALVAPFGLRSQARPREGGLGAVEIELSGSGLRDRCPMTLARKGDGRMGLTIYPITELLEVIGEVTTRAILHTLSGGLNVVVGRSYDESMQGVVSPSELAGEIEWIDWFQFYGEPVAVRWGVGYLEEGPFERVERWGHAACGLTLVEGQYSLPLQRIRLAAMYLGIRLRSNPLGL